MPWRDASPGVSDAVDQRRNGDAADGDVDLRKMALYWATRKQFEGGSPSLTTHEASTVDEKYGIDLPHSLCYRFVGSARFDHVPGHAQRDALVISSNGGKVPPYFSFSRRHKQNSSVCDSKVTYNGLYLLIVEIISSTDSTAFLPYFK